MFKCTVCQKLYNSQVSYCDCGNNEFTYVADSIPSEPPKKETSAGDYISAGIFILCIVLALSVLFFYNPVKPRHKTVPVQTETESAISSVPDINEIWNDKPLYEPSYQGESSIEIYKKSLQNMLNSNIQPKQYNGTGSCRIEFTVTSTGKLANRRMFKDSGSEEFNNIILKMLKNSNDYRKPPSDYSGETIRGDVIVQDGLIKLYIK